MAQCDQGHALSGCLMRHLVGENRAYSSGYRCDRCGRSYPYNPTEMLLHCTPCGFDVCVSCSSKPTPARKTTPTAAVTATVTPTPTPTSTAVTPGFPSFPAPGSVSESVSQFGINLIIHSLGLGLTNAFVSPFSVSQMLSLLSCGAQGSTQQEILQALRITPSEAPTLSGSYQTINATLKRAPAEIICANSTWLREGYQLAPAFIEQAAAFDAAGFPLPSSAAPINAWCSENTRGRITQIISAIPHDLVAMLVNAIYFKATFRDPFDISLTRNKTFHNIDGSASQLPMMCKPGEYMNYQETHLMQAVSLWYGPPPHKSTQSCVVVLPKPGISPMTLLEDPQLLNKLWTGSYSYKKGTLELPRFTVSCGMELSDILRKLGIRQAFGSSADFRGLCTPSGVSISQVIHKTFVLVDEQGTEAAAVTGGTLCSCVEKEKPFSMIVDRPFLFFILDNPLKLMLFGGLIGAPTSV
ncbi:serine protease inhibitor [Pelomyxa schiedti]|nr:serine protease inhibitor [Pelomyxa schiedti]